MQFDDSVSDVVSLGHIKYIISYSDVRLALGLILRETKLSTKCTAPAQVDLYVHCSG